MGSLKCRETEPARSRFGSAAKLKPIGRAHGAVRSGQARGRYLGAAHGHRGTASLGPASDQPGPPAPRAASRARFEPEGGDTHKWEQGPSRSHGKPIKSPAAAPDGPSCRLPCATSSVGLQPTWQRGKSPAGGSPAERDVRAPGDFPASFKFKPHLTFSQPF